MSDVQQGVENSVENGVDCGEAKVDVAEQLKTLKPPCPRDREIFKLVENDRLEQAEVGRKFELSQARVSQIVTKVRLWIAAVGDEDVGDFSPEMLVRYATAMTRMRLNRLLDLTMAGWEESKLGQSEVRKRKEPYAPKTNEETHRSSCGDLKYLTHYARVTLMLAKLDGVPMSPRTVVTPPTNEEAWQAVARRYQAEHSEERVQEQEQEELQQLQRELAGREAAAQAATERRAQATRDRRAAAAAKVQAAAEAVAQAVAAAEADQLKEAAQSKDAPPQAKPKTPPATAAEDRGQDLYNSLIGMLNNSPAAARAMAAKFGMAGSYGQPVAPPAAPSPVSAEQKNAYTEPVVEPVAEPVKPVAAEAKPVVEEAKPVADAGKKALDAYNQARRRAFFAGAPPMELVPGK